VFVDLKKAFYVCDHKILLYKLKNYSVKNHAHNWSEGIPVREEADNRQKTRNYLGPAFKEVF
jgi:hypothetical protein